MKFIHLVAYAALCTLPAAAASSYTMTFTGGISTNPDGGLIPLAPDSGSFTYDSATGFSRFFVSYQGDTFDLTSAANSFGTPAADLALLMEDQTWTSYEATSPGTTVTALDLSNGIMAYATLFPGFTLGDSARAGAFALSGPGAPSTGGPAPGNPGPGPSDPGTPASATPEPASASLLIVAGLAFLGLKAKAPTHRLTFWTVKGISLRQPTPLPTFSLAVSKDVGPRGGVKLR